jgi:acylphosphatase
MKNIIVIVSGRVQGVGFRSFINSKAKELKLNGYVKNLSNGDVEIQISGENKNVEKMLEIIKKGSPWSHVEKVNIEKTNNQVNEGFIIK